MGGGKPKEPKDAKLLRQRQLIDLADLDEEENKRIKALFRARQGGRAFRAPTASRVAGDSAGSNASASASIIPSTGFQSPARGLSTRAPRGGKGQLPGGGG